MTTARTIALTDVTPLADFINYIAGRWYIPSGLGGNGISGTAPGIGSIRLIPAIIKQKCTISDLGVRVSINAAGNVQAAIYANDPAIMRPTGAALASTSSLNTASVANVTATLGATVQFPAGLYWFAVNTDNATAAFGCPAAGALSVAALIGSATAGGALLTTAALQGLSIAQTFGTWPDLTGGSFAEVEAATLGIVEFKVASVP